MIEKKEVPKPPLLVRKQNPEPKQLVDMEKATSNEDSREE
jgi:hypothetical protein